jgi:hypothetical protein
VRYLVTILLVAAAAAVGYFSRELTGSKTHGAKLPFPDLSYSPSTFDLGCAVTMEGVVFENRFDGPSAHAHAGVGTEKLALKLSGDGKTLSLLYASAVSRRDRTNPACGPLQNDKLRRSSRSTNAR